MNTALANRLNTKRLQRLGILEEPMGYVDGANLYEYVGSEPLAIVDPAGLYRIKWDKESNWSDAEKKRILDSITRVKARTDVLLPQLDRVLNDLKAKKCNKPAMEYAISQIEELRDVIYYIGKGINETSPSLEITFRFVKTTWESKDEATGKMVTNTDASMRHMQKTFGHNEIQFNLNALKTWDTLKDDILDKNMLHELSHEYGTEDNEDKGPLMYAHNVDQLMNYPREDLSRFFKIKLLILEAMKECGEGRACGCPEPDKNA